MAAKSIEQIVRDVLEAVVKDASLFGLFASGIDPQTFSSGDLVGPANVLSDAIGVVLVDAYGIVERDD
jgi:hypothetical protein